ncbi:hypothetical protein PSN45_003424 [Yamadazyma tenuis]|uniref:mRNA stability protein n=1 Tax=Candida tenuis (strain ATCC 10573 / BCRC 21748 / CBS 615 / JCM 9827 / NBRC 10315 / NRRL Y-1498 / VKM Y-70) TaxID=590646 RepID=G3AY72_CANTC|nr:uncharacterized protein CANTEDRAFT_92115 [Yamadazyma tenuis ATCC 10573]EGV65782.1 hypothetical protein CANTEDRAFT_92115 [Yamadazyma tenuis ATCC 10573]WEJ95893.1 hypothetical protein PSN45_003424 [Yamadazyma tenuis]
MSLNEDDPLGPPKNTQNLDLNKLTPDELKIYRMYGKLPTRQQILTSKIKEKKYFDSGDYAMQKQLGGSKSSVPSSMPMSHPNAEKVKEMYNRNSISNASVLPYGKSNLLHERTAEDEETK